MKIIIQLFVIYFAFSQNDFRLGLKAGINYVDQTWHYNGTNFGDKNILTPIIVIFTDFKISEKLSFLPEIGYSQKGREHEVLEKLDTEVPGRFIIVRDIFHYIFTMQNIHYSIYKDKIYIGVGLGFNYVLKNNDESQVSNCLFLPNFYHFHIARRDGLSIAKAISS
jgi:hypothetical protein